MEKKKITKKEVMDAVKKHQHFLNKDCDDWILMRADFSNCLIEDIELKKLDLLGADLSGANIDFANFGKAEMDDCLIRSIYDSVKVGNVPCLGLEEVHLVAYKFAQLIARNSNLNSGERIRLCVNELVDYINTLPVAEKLGKIYK